MTPYYDNSGITIYHGDSRDVLPTLSRCDLLLTDPPYGIGEARGKNKTRTHAALATDYGVANWDDEPVDSALLALALSKARWQILFGGNFYSVAPSSCWLVWDKDNTGDFADCELAWTNLPKSVRKIRWRWNGMLQEHGGKKKEPRWHPTQKPVEVIKWAIGQAPPECASILDPFMGSGTTLRAAKDLGRRAIGIEIEEKYCEIAAKRLAQEVLF